MRIILTLLLFCFSGCTTCLKPRDFDALMVDKEFENEELSFLNGKYKCIKYDIFGNEKETKCLTVFENGVIKHHSGRVILMKEATLVLDTKDTKVYEFTHDNINYQLFVEPYGMELLSIDNWDLFRKIEEKKNEK